MDGFDNVTAIPGSRHPILIPDSRFGASSSSSHTPTPPSTGSSNRSFTAPRHRRKPAKTFKSPSADEPAEWGGLTIPRKRGTPPYEKPPSRQSSSDFARPSPPISIPARRAAAQRKVPLLPLYHPLGPLAQSLPELDPGHFGLPSSLSVDEPDSQREGDNTRRSASRTQRPGQKPRDTGDDDVQPNGIPNGTGKPSAETPARNPSPRKRRGGGAKRKRKDAEDGDPAFPAPPAKRTRNPRGGNLNAPAAPSPLISEAVVASDLVEDAVEGGGEPEVPQEEAPPAPKRSARTRKPRARPPKRRDSSGSASTTTSVSVSIAATAKPPAHAKLEGEPATPSAAPEGKPRPAAEPEQAAPVRTEDAPGAEEVKKQMEELPTVPQEQPRDETPGIVAPDVIPEHEEPLPKPSASAVLPAPPTPTPPHLPSPAPVPPPQKEEREEGELSDDA